MTPWISMDIVQVMKQTKRPKRRPAVLVRFYDSDLARLNEHCAKACTPRENFIRRCTLEAIRVGGGLKK